MPTNASLNRPSVSGVVVLSSGLFLGEGTGEGDGGIEETLTSGVIRISFGGCTDVAGHATASHDDGANIGYLKSPAVALGSYAQHEAAPAGTAKQVAVEKKGPPAEHRFFSKPRQASECGMNEFFETGIASHG